MAADITTRPSASTAADTATRGSVLSEVLRGQRRSLVLWAIAIGVVSLIYVSFYPAIGDEQMGEMAEMIPEDLASALGYDRLGDAAGYLASTIFGLLGPALLLVFGIGAGARLVAGQEEDGTLELELTHPVARRSVYVERLLGLWANVAILVGVLGLVTSALVVALDMDVRAVGLVAGTIGLLVFVVAHATIALAVGAATGRRVYGLASAAGLAVVGYIANALGPMVDVGWITAISPWAWFLDADPVTEGFAPGGLALLAALAVVPAVLGLLRFERRDLGV